MGKYVPAVREINNLTRDQPTPLEIEPLRQSPARANAPPHEQKGGALHTVAQRVFGTFKDRVPRAGGTELGELS